MWLTSWCRVRARASRRRCDRRWSSAAVERLEERTLPAAWIAAASESGALPEVRIFTDRDGSGTYETLTAAFFPFGGAFTIGAVFQGGVRVATGDLDADGDDELIVGAAAGRAPTVQIYEVAADGSLIGLKEAFDAYSPLFRGGVEMAAGDLDGNGRDELVVAIGSGERPAVRIFSDIDRDGFVGDGVIEAFYAYDPRFVVGVRVSVGDTNVLRGGEELVTVPAPGLLSLVRVFTDSDRDMRLMDNLPEVESALVYDPRWGGGAWLYAGSRGLITGPDRNTPPLVRVFFDADRDGRLFDDPVFDQFLVTGGGGGFVTGGVRVSLDPIRNAILTVNGPGAVTQVKSIDDAGPASGVWGRGVLRDSFLPFGGDTSGAFIAWGEVGLDLTAPVGTVGLARPFVEGFRPSTFGGLFAMLADEPLL
jgi:hypothetical protein